MEENKKQSEVIIEIIKEYKTRSNKDLIKAMDFIQADFDYTKKAVIELTNHIDKLEHSYNVLLNEFNSRKGNE
jgi:NADH:ubiquinone oxidoreductase subunit E